jgi:hypothetical protein
MLRLQSNTGWWLVTHVDHARLAGMFAILALPQTTVKTATDPNTQQPATYTGVDLNELIQALPSSPEQTVLGANCYDGYQQYYDPDYNEKHHPIFLLKYDGKSPADWPKSEHNSPMGPLLCRA